MAGAAVGENKMHEYTAHTLPHRQGGASKGSSYRGMGAVDKIEESQVTYTSCTARALTVSSFLSCFSKEKLGKEPRE